jgi:hypothetical protein
MEARQQARREAHWYLEHFRHDLRCYAGSLMIIRFRAGEDETMDLCRDRLGAAIESGEAWSGVILATNLGQLYESLSYIKVRRSVLEKL